MTTYNLTKKTNASTGTQIVPSSQEIRIQRLENKVSSQSLAASSRINIRSVISKSCFFKTLESSNLRKSSIRNLNSLSGVL